MYILERTIFPVPSLKCYLAPEPLGRFTNAPGLTRPNTDDVRMDSTGDAVLHLSVELGQDVPCITHNMLQRLETVSRGEIEQWHNLKTTDISIQ